jgi:hypothetical protein
VMKRKLGPTCDDKCRLKCKKTYNRGRKTGDIL